MTARTTAAERAEISRQNGRKSHGPTSIHGKSRSKMNAIKHGMTARVPVLPGEDPETFHQHVESIVESLAPHNALELALAEQAALSLWKIERAERVEAAQLRGERPLYLETSEWEWLVQERHVKNNPALVEESRRELLDQLTDGRAADPAGPTRALRRLVEEEVARLEELEGSHRRR